jgi:uncharacterized DUF497 family protein
MKLPGIDWDENKNAINKFKHNGYYQIDGKGWEKDT